MTSCPITVLLVDDQLLLRDALAHWLRNLPGIHLAGLAAGAEDALAEIRRLRPNVVLMNADMPAHAPLQVARTIRTRFPDTRLIFLGAFQDERSIEQALAAGACACVSRHDPPEALVRDLGGPALQIRDDAPHPSISPMSPPAGPQSPSSTLTPREQEVLRHLAAGLTKKEIARLLFISANTVNRHTDNIMAKLDIHDRVRLARYAIRHGLAEPVAP